MSIQKIVEIINGALLGDGTIQEKDGKYFYFRYVAKDKKLIEWVMKLLKNNGIKKCYIVHDNKISDTWSVGFYINTQEYSGKIIELVEQWYIKLPNGKRFKVLPKNIELTPLTMLLWYIGDGSLIRHKNPNRVPWIVLATNNFSKEDVNFLISKLKQLDMNFYAVRMKSGFHKGYAGYSLFSRAGNATPFNFFKYIGLKPPKEIANAIVGKRGSKIYRVKDKFPTEDDWIKMLSNVPSIGKLLNVKKKRIEMGLTQKQLADIIGVSREMVRDFENGKRNMSLERFERLVSEMQISLSNLHK
ncbi:MAG: helix-turn-helix domain-containing protein [Candidatus Aenigmarchaeota archaeon]|nr:helix-turn-helix domain-containing protein [Candidatus Aenigmarchaeota archaeon]